MNVLPNLVQLPDSGPFNSGVESYDCVISVLEITVGPNLAFNTVVLATLVQNHLSDYESIRDEFRAKPCVPDSGPFNAGVESYECLISV